MTHELLTATELQELFDLDRSTIYRMAGDGRLPAVKIGRGQAAQSGVCARAIHPITLISL